MGGLICCTELVRGPTISSVRTILFACFNGGPRPLSDLCDFMCGEEEVAEGFSSLGSWRNILLCGWAPKSKPAACIIITHWYIEVEDILARPRLVNIPWTLYITIHICLILSNKIRRIKIIGCNFFLIIMKIQMSISFDYVVVAIWWAERYASAANSRSRIQHFHFIMY